MPWKKYILELKQEFDERGYLYIIDEPVGVIYTDTQERL